MKKKPLVDDEEVPEHHRPLAQSDEDAVYQSDVSNISQSSVFNSGGNPLEFMIRLRAESFKNWHTGYEARYIGSKILYPGFNFEIKRSIFESERIQQTILDQSRKQVAAMFKTIPDDLEVYQRNLSLKRREIEERTKSILDTLVADMSNMSIVRFAGYIVENILVRMFNQGIHIKESEFGLVKQAAVECAASKQSIVFLPCHKSHVDYLVIQYIFYRLGIALPHIAAGDNLNIPIVGSILKQGGAFFIKRTFNKDELYSDVVREYIEILLKRGHNIEAFIEGTRSRTGKLLNPRFGILKIVLDAVLSGRVDDVVIVPMSIDYDKVIETETYVNELLGTPKEKESLWGILNAASILSVKLGRIDIRFAKPYTLSSFIESEMKRRSTESYIFSPLGSVHERNLILRALGYRVLSDINSVSVIQPTSLVGTILLTLRGRGVGQIELCRRVSWLRREIIVKGGRVADFAGSDVETIVLRAVKALSSMVGVRKDLVEPVFYVAKRFELSLFRNQVIHLFLGESVVAAAMYSTIKKGQTHRRIPRANLLRDVTFISQLVKNEFIFKPGGVDDNLNDAIQTLSRHGVIEVETEQGERVDIAQLRSTQYFVRLSDKERSIGRENFDFYCFLIWPFIETYWLAAAGLFSLIPAEKSGITESVMMDRIQHFGKALYYEGDLGYFESINKETLRNAFERYKEMGLVVTRTEITRTEETDEELHGIVLWAVNPVYETEALQFMKDPQAVYSDIYSFNNSGQKTVYTTKLWSFVENVGKFRREGKHRRDNEVTGKRTLRLAYLSRLGDQEAKI